MTLAALGVVMGSIVDTMRAADLPNDVVHAFIDRLDDGFGSVLLGDALGIMYELVDILRVSCGKELPPTRGASAAR